MKQVRGIICVSLALLSATLFGQQPTAPPAPAIDLSGYWSPVMHEDAFERGAGNEIADYGGFPLNEAGRLFALSYDPSRGLVFANIMNLGQVARMERRTDSIGGVTYKRTSPWGSPYGRFWNPETKIPCSAPPFGELVAVEIDEAHLLRPHEALRHAFGCGDQAGVVEPDADVAVVGRGVSTRVHPPADFDDVGAKLLLSAHSSTRCDSVPSRSRRARARARHPGAVGPRSSRAPRSGRGPQRGDEQADRVRVPRVHDWTLVFRARSRVPPRGSSRPLAALLLLDVSSDTTSSSRLARSCDPSAEIDALPLDRTLV